MTFLELFKGKPVWTFAIYASDSPFTTDFEQSDPIKIFSSRHLRLFGSGPHTQADPFLLADGRMLYVFYERMSPGSVGKIACARTSDLEMFEDCGIVLDEPHHLSWPFAFRSHGAVYIVPESTNADEVSLYRFEALPGPVAKVRNLLSGRYADPLLVEHGGCWYLFATSEAGLELFLSPDLLTGEFRKHPKSPITNDPRFSRSGGNILHLDGRMLRVAQDCSQTYGENISLIEIHRLTPDDYAEEIVAPSFLKRRTTWNREGGHHLSVASFKGQTVVATDGRHRDYWINRFLPGRNFTALRRDIARRSPNFLRATVRMVEHYLRRHGEWVRVLYHMKGATFREKLILWASALIGPITSLRRLDGFEPPLLLGDVEVIIRNVGRFRLRGGTDDVVATLPSREPHVANVVMSMLQPGDIFVDAGANIGFYSVMAHQRIGPDGRIISIEMMAETAACLREHLALNGVSNATVVEKALSDEDDKLVTAAMPAHKLGQATIAPARALSGSEPRTVRTVRLDQVLADFPTIALMKMDLEGAEFAALRGASAILPRVRAIVFENESRDERIERLLVESGFTVQRLHGVDFLATRS